MPDRRQCNLCTAIELARLHVFPLDAMTADLRQLFEGILILYAALLPIVDPFVARRSSWR